MPALELTPKQIVETVRKLPKRVRQYVIGQLLSDSGEIPQGRRALATFTHLRDQFCLEPRKEQRLSDLLAKANEGVLTEREQRELGTLLDESHAKTMELALAVVGSAASSRTDDGKTQQ